MGLEQRGDVPPDARGIPLFAAVGNRSGGKRLSRRDLRAVQDLLGYAAPRATARYARVVDKALNNPAAAVPIRL